MWFAWRETELKTKIICEDSSAIQSLSVTGFENENTQKSIT